MRQHSWTLLRNSARNFSNHQSHRQFQVLLLQPHSNRTLSSLHTLPAVVPQFLTNPTNPKFPIFTSRGFSSEPLVEQPQQIQEQHELPTVNENPDRYLLVSDVFSKFTDVGIIEKELELNGVVVTNDLVLNVLKSLQSRPEAARRFFDWVLMRDGEKLCSKGYNLMLGILGVNGLVDGFWGLFEIMKKKGYGVSKGTHDKVLEKFEKEGLKSDVERVRGIFESGSADTSSEKIGLRVSRIIRNSVWSEAVESGIKNLNVAFNSDLVKIVVENLAIEPTKALIFFRWVEESGLCKHDKRSYNAIARVLGREDCIDRFWKVVDEMRSSGHEMEMETFDKVFARFVKRKMVKDAVDLYEFAMSGPTKPPVQCCTFLLRKIVVAKELDMGLFSRVVRIITQSGFVLSDSMLNSVLKSLTSVGKFGECNKVLKELKDGGYTASGTLQRKIVYGLSSSGKKDVAGEFVDHMESSGVNFDYKVWASLIEGHCASGDLENASDCFQKMVLKVGVSNAGYAFEKLITSYCRKNRAIDGSKLLHHYVSEQQLRPWHATYKGLISRLLVQGGFGDALGLLHLMKNHGFPPYSDPFIEYVSKSGTADDAIAFMKATSVKNFPSTSVVLRVFEAFFRARRYSDAQDLLSKCPRYIRRHPDVLDLFCSMKSGKDTAASTVAA